MAAPTSRFAEHGPLRVLWLIDSLTLGGAESLVAEFTGALDPRRLSVQVCCLTSIGDNPIEEELWARKVACTNLNSRHLRDIGALRRLVGLVRRERFDLIHAHLTYAAIWGALVSRFTKVPLLTTLHVKPSTDPVWSREGLRHRLMCMLLSVWCARVLAVSNSLRRAYVETNRIKAEKLIVVHNGVNCRATKSVTAPQGLSLRRSLGIREDAPLVTTVSVLREGKGVEVLLEATRQILAHHGDVSFLVVGDGPMRKNLEDVALASGVGDRVHFLGFRRDIPTILRASDLFVLPSLEDAFPTVLMEAMAAELPIVATRVGGVPEIIDAPATGRLIPAGDADALGRAVIDLLGRPEERTAMGERARRRAEDHFSIEVWLERLMAVYLDVVSEQPIRSLVPIG
ncbi:MAG TPA: glycosyltransferase [Methylomirabilota bacterium]|nr:glycosyltransferase [Methylomirabilota bacterium]